MTQRFLDLGQHCIPDAARGSRSHPPPPPGASSPVLPDGGGGFRHASCEATMETAEPLCRAEFSTRWKELATMVTPIEREALLELLHRDHYSVDELARLLGVDPHRSSRTPRPAAQGLHRRPSRARHLPRGLIRLDRPPSRDTGPPPTRGGFRVWPPPRPSAEASPCAVILIRGAYSQEKNGASLGIAPFWFALPRRQAERRCYGEKSATTQPLVPSRA